MNSENGVLFCFVEWTLHARSCCQCFGSQHACTLAMKLGNNRGDRRSCCNWYQSENRGSSKEYMIWSTKSLALRLSLLCKYLHVWCLNLCRSSGVIVPADIMGCFPLLRLKTVAFVPFEDVFVIKGSTWYLSEEEEGPHL